MKARGQRDVARESRARLVGIDGDHFAMAKDADRIRDILVGWGRRPLKD